MNEHYNVSEAIAAQDKYCETHYLPHFAPHDGYCFACGHQIYDGEMVNAGTRQYHTGISVESAGSTLVTGCPHCLRSYVD